MNSADLREYRKSLGLSQEALAEKLGVSRGKIHAYESGKWPDGNVAPITKEFALAFGAIYHRLDQWGQM